MSANFNTDLQLPTGAVSVNLLIKPRPTPLPSVPFLLPSPAQPTQTPGVLPLLTWCPCAAARRCQLPPWEGTDEGPGARGPQGHLWQTVHPALHTQAHTQGWMRGVCGAHAREVWAGKCGGVQLKVQASKETFTDQAGSFPFPSPHKCEPQTATHHANTSSNCWSVLKRLLA